MKIYLDDLRATPEGWTRAYTVEQVQELMLNNRGLVTNMSLDHDLGASYLCPECTEKLCGDEYDCFDDCKCAACHDPNRRTPTGYDLVKWMIEHDAWPLYKPLVHSANPVGAMRMRQDIEKYWHPPTGN